MRKIILAAAIATSAFAPTASAEDKVAVMTSKNPEFVAEAMRRILSEVAPDNARQEAA